MIVTIENNPQKGPGHARISLRLRSGEPFPALPASPQFIIESPGREEFLGNGQWAQSETRLTPDSYFYENGAIVLEVGPQVVDSLEALENYRFHLLMPQGEKSGALVCKNIIPSPMQSGHTGFGNFEAIRLTIRSDESAAHKNTPDSPPEQNIQLPPQTESVQTPAPDYTLPDFSKLDDAPLSLPPQQDSASRLEQLAGETGSKSSRGKIAALILILILLAAIGAGAWFFIASPLLNTGNATLQEDAALLATDGPDTAGANASAEQENRGANQTGTRESNSSSQPKDTPNPENFPKVPPKDSAGLESLHMAHGILRDNPDEDGLRRALGMMQHDDANADAIFLLREELAERGDSESMFLLAQFYDPSVAMPRGSIEPDPEQAVHWYKRAQAGGWQSSAPALDSLKNWLRQEKEKGNPLAESLLNSME